MSRNIQNTCLTALIAAILSVQSRSAAAEERVSPRVLKGHGCSVIALVFTPDSKSLASVCFAPNQPDFYLWNLETGKKRFEFEQPWPSDEEKKFRATPGLAPDTDTDEKSYGRAPHMFAVSPKGALIVDSHDLWSLPDGKSLYRIGHPRVRNVYFQAKRIVNGKEVGTLVGTMYPAASAVNAAAISPDGRLFAGGGTNQHGLTLWSLAQRKLVANLPVVGNPSIGGELVAVYFAPDQRFVFAAYGDGSIFRWSLRTPEKPAFFFRPPPSTAAHDIHSMIMTPDGKFLVVAIRCPTSTTAQNVYLIYDTTIYQIMSYVKT